MLSHTERLEFHTISRAMAADPRMAAAARAGDLRVWRHRLWTWLAPRVVARRRARYVRRFAQGS